MADLSKYTDENIIDVLSSDAEAELRNRGYDYGWFKKDKFVGSIYILVNPAFPNLVKIGYADDVQKRIKSLNSNSGLPDPFHCYAVYKVRKRLEDLKLHDLIDSLDSSLRHSKNREFFEMDAEKAFSILSAISQINGDDDQLVKNPFDDDFFKFVVKSKSVTRDTLSGIHLVGDSRDFSGNNQNDSVDVSSKRDNKRVKPDMQKIPNGRYYVDEDWRKYGKVFASMRVEDGKFIVEKGSMCLPCNKSWQPRPRREAVIENGILQKDVVCNSPSTAIYVVLGSSFNGWIHWKTSDGQLIDIYRK